jgi:hypothetical protein
MQKMIERSTLSVGRSPFLARKSLDNEHVQTNILAWRAENLFLLLKNRPRAAWRFEDAAHLGVQRIASKRYTSI